MPGWCQGEGAKNLEYGACEALSNLITVTVTVAVTVTTGSGLRDTLWGELIDGYRINRAKGPVLQQPHSIKPKKRQWPEQNGRTVHICIPAHLPTIQYSLART